MSSISQQQTPIVLNTQIVHTSHMNEMYARKTSTHMGFCDLSKRSKPWHYLLNQIEKGVSVIRLLQVSIHSIETVDEACLLYNCLTNRPFDWVVPPFTLRNCQVTVNHANLLFHGSKEQHLGHLLSAVRRFHICVQCPMPKIRVFANEWYPTSGEMWFLKEWLKVMSHCIIDLDFRQICVNSPDVMGSFLDGLHLPYLQEMYLSDYLLVPTTLAYVLPHPKQQQPQQPLPIPLTNNVSNAYDVVYDHHHQSQMELDKNEDDTADIAIDEIVFTSTTKTQRGGERGRSSQQREEDDDERGERQVVSLSATTTKKSYYTTNLMTAEEKKPHDFVFSSIPLSHFNKGLETDDEKQIRCTHNPIVTMVPTSDFVLTTPSPSPPSSPPLSMSTIHDDATLRNSTTTTTRSIRNPFVPNLTSLRTSIRILELRHLRLYPTQMDAVLKCLRDFRNLFTLDLSQNTINAYKLGSLMRHCKNLKSLKLEHVQFENQLYLGTSLLQGKNLQQLSLNWSRLSSKTLKNLPRSLQRIPQLEYLNMRHVGFGEVTGLHIIPLIRNMVQLKELDVTENESLHPASTSTCTVAKICKQLATTASLRKLQMNGDLRQYCAFPRYWYDVHHKSCTNVSYLTLPFQYSETEYYALFQHIYLMKLMLLSPIRLQQPQQPQQHVPFIDDFYSSPYADTNLISRVVFDFLGV